MTARDLGLLTLEDLADALGVSASTVRAWVDAGQIPVWQPGGEGGRIYVSASALEAWAREHSAPRARPEAPAAPPCPSSSPSRPTPATSL